MQKKVHSSPRKKSIANDDRTTKILNSITNTSIILMSTMMGGFAQAMVEVTEDMAAEMAGSVDPTEGGKIKAEIDQKLPQVDEEMKSLVAEVRKDLYEQTEQKRKDIEPLISDPIFDQGPKIVERYDFGIPKLTERLDDASLAKYTQLLVSEDPSFSSMFKELTDWINSLPKPPEKSVGE